MKYKNIKITPKVFCFSSDKPTRIFPFQAISLIRPPGPPAEKADRRIWRMMAIVRRLAFLYSLLYKCSLFIRATDRKTTVPAIITAATYP